MKSKSFSLIEILVVLGVISFVLLISVPRLSIFNKVILKNELEKLFTTFSFLQQRAIASNIEQKIIFDLDQNTYSYNLHKHRLPGSVKFGFLQGTKGPQPNVSTQ